MVYRDKKFFPDKIKGSEEVMNHTKDYFYLNILGREEGAHGLGFRPAFFVVFLIALGGLMVIVGNEWFFFGGRAEGLDEHGQGLIVRFFWGFAIFFRIDFWPRICRPLRGNEEYIGIRLRFFGIWKNRVAMIKMNLRSIF